MVCHGSPPQVEADDPLSRLRVGGLVEQRETAASSTAEEEGFGIETGILGPGVKIAPGDSDYRSAESAEVIHVCRKCVGNGYFTKLRVARIVDVAAGQYVGTRLQTRDQRRIVLLREIPLPATPIHDAAEALAARLLLR